jgi:formate--tetrahydrofolate ligase
VLKGIESLSALPIHGLLGVLGILAVKTSSGEENSMPLSDIEIAQQAKMKRVVEVAAKLGIPEQHLEPYGHYKAKVSLEYVDSLKGKPNGKLVLVTGDEPDARRRGQDHDHGGFGDGLNHIGKKAIICLREPSLGPVFGVKGGAAGGGYAQVVPMEDINLHFTGDFNAIALANNLLAAMIDNHITQGNELGIDPRRITWRRVMDMNDRRLRDIVISLGGTANGYPREDGFDIVVASEVMAIFCLATSVKDLKERLGNIVFGYTRDGKALRARDLKAHGAMTVLLKNQIAPNLVQTLENNPAFIHGGPFANIAHGCNSVIATQTALKLADYVVTEAGFGADLGAEKFLDIKCRKAGLKPDAAVIVATVRALKHHGGAARDALNKEDLAALEKGLINLERHVRNVKDVYNIPCVVSVNRFIADTKAEMDLLTDRIGKLGAKGRGGHALGRWRKGCGRAGPHRRRDVRAEVEPDLRLRGCRSAVGEDEEDRHARLRRSGRHRRCQSAYADQGAAGGRLRELPRMRRQDPVVVHDRSQRARRALRAHRERTRGAACRGRGVRRDDLRRHDDHARAAEGAFGGEDRRYRRRQGGGALLGASDE